MRKLATAVLMTLGLAAVALLAADFWQTKKFTDWTDKEVQKILKDSPWARPVEVRLGGGGGGLGEAGGGGGPGGGGGGEASVRLPAVREAGLTKAAVAADAAAVAGWEALKLRRPRP